MDISVKQINEIDHESETIQQDYQQALEAFAKNVSKSKTVCDLYIRQDEAKALARLKTKIESNGI